MQKGNATRNKLLAHSERVHARLDESQRNVCSVSCISEA